MWQAVYVKSDVNEKFNVFWIFFFTGMTLLFQSEQYIGGNQSGEIELLKTLRSLVEGSTV
jgi:hypothetical protein